MAFQDVSQKRASGPYPLQGEDVSVVSGPWESEAITAEKPAAQEEAHSQHQMVPIPATADMALKGPQLLGRPQRHPVEGLQSHQRRAKSSWKEEEGPG